MYFLTASLCAIAAAVLWFFFRDRKGLHLDVLTIIFAAAALMWLVDCFYSLAAEGVFLSFDDPKDGWIALWTVAGGTFLWLVLSFIFNFSGKTGTSTSKVK